MNNANNIYGDLAVEINELITRINAAADKDTAEAGLVLETFAARKAILSQINTLTTAALDLVASLRSAAAVMTAGHLRDTNTANSVLGLPSWTKVPTRSRPLSRRAVGMDPDRVLVTPSLSLGVIRVAAFADVKQDGSLYFVEPADHFAVRINGVLFHGNIGTIFSDGVPEKIKDCKYTSGCNKHGKCDYYHDPMIFPNSRDCRNYTSNSFLYYRANARGHSRRFGSRPHLDIDIVGVSQEDISRYLDQTMHDLLCALLLAGRGL